MVGRFEPVAEGEPGDGIELLWTHGAEADFRCPLNVVIADVAGEISRVLLEEQLPPVSGYVS